MARPKGSRKPPAYKHRKRGDRGYTVDNGQWIYFPGKYKSAESIDAYNRWLADWALRGGPLPKPSAAGITVAELVARYWTAEVPARNLKPRAVRNLKLQLRYFTRLYGDTPAREFTAIPYKTFREQLIRTPRGRKENSPKTLSRGYINLILYEVRRAMKWGVEMELVPENAHHGLQAVGGLHAGKSRARDNGKVFSVPPAQMQSTLKLLTPTVAAMVEFQSLTGARSGEVCAMRPIDIDTTKPVWIYRPVHHKNESKGIDRLVPICPRAQEIIRAFMPKNLHDYCFRPSESHLHRRQLGRAKTQAALDIVLADHSLTTRPTREARFAQLTGLAPTTMQTAERVRRQILRGDEPVKRKNGGDHYTPNSYYQLVRHACERAKVGHWHVHRLRHNAATELADQFGERVAQAVLGHTTVKMTRRYIDKLTPVNPQQWQEAIEALAKIG